MAFQLPTALPIPTEAALMQRNNELFQENCVRTNNEQQLFAAWRQVKGENEKIIEEYKKLQFEVNKMREDFKKVMFKNSQLEKILNQPKEEEIIEYFTDEEELAKETEWIRIKEKNKNKKRKMNTSLTPPPRNKTDDKPKEKLPPPIIIDGVQNFNALHEKINMAMVGCQFKIVNNNSIKVNVPDGACYRQLITILNETSLQYHSYENKQERPIKVMAKNLHHECNTNKIADDLRRQGFKIIRAVNKLKWKTKEPLNMFMLEFENKENIDKIFQIKNILGIAVTIEAIKNSRLIPQCKNCQAYGHTRHYCAMQARCVKCAGKHPTNECTKPANQKPKCIHCGEPHPANYRGCKVAKELQKIRLNRSKKTSLPPHVNNEQAKANKNANKNGKEIQNKKSSEVNTNVTYAQATKDTKRGNENVPNNQQYSTIEASLQMIMKKLSDQEKAFKRVEERLTVLEYGNKGAIPKSKNGQRT